MEKTRWGSAGAGKIAHRFAEGLMHVKGAQPAAVASRSLEKAKAFAAQYGFEKSFVSYEEMALDNSIDIVYVATPHTMHMRDALMFLGAGRAVVCEKPLAVNAYEAEAMIRKAREKNVFFMEGMWTRFFPAIKKSLEWIKQGRIGTPKMLHASFGYDREEKTRGGTTALWPAVRCSMWAFIRSHWRLLCLAPPRINRQPSRAWKTA